MLDRWIPDEDWVRRIRDNGKNDCTLVNFNMGMSTQCSWQNNHAILKGRTIFYNKKKSDFLRLTNQLAFTMFYPQLLRQLRTSQVIKPSTNRYGTTQNGASAPSSEQPLCNKPINHRPPRRPMYHPLCLLPAITHCRRRHQSCLKRRAE